jgi:DNA-binding NarL/FixJ family response regulator
MIPGVETSVVIIDDHAPFRAAARRLLEAGGLCVLGEAASGESGLIEVWRLRPDVVVLDVRLPGIDGFEVATRLTQAGWDGEILLVSSRPARQGATFPADGRVHGVLAKEDLSPEAVTTLRGRRR